MALNPFLIKKPWITEKTTALNEIGKYVFIVQPKATKSEIRKTIHEIYKVDAVSVNIVNRPTKAKKFRNVQGTQPGYRKAIVTLKAGQKIDLAR